MIALGFEPEHDQRCFTQLTELLLQYQDLWRPEPFVELAMPWTQRPAHQQLYQGLLSLEELELQQLAQPEALRQWMQDYIPELAQLEQMWVAVSEQPAIELTKFSDVGVPGRKKQQISHFAGCLSELPFIQQAKLVDWCSGKGHLAAHLERSFAAQVTCLEYQPQLCEAGREIAKQQQLAMSFVCQDVLQPIDEQIPELFNA